MGGGRRRLRGALGWVPALVLVPAGLAGAVYIAKPAAPPPVVHELFPLDAGTTWVYAVSDHGKPSGTHTRQVLGQVSLIGLDTKLLDATRVGETWTDYPGPGARTSSAYFVPEGDRIDQWGLIGPDHRLQQLKPTAAVYEHVDHVGDSWTYTGTLDVQDLSYTTKLAERGPVSVGGRTFDGCSRFVTTIPVVIEGQPTADETQEEWTCPGYGAVRSSDHYAPTGVDITEELVEFHGDEGNWYADGASSAAATDPGTEPSTEPGTEPATSLGFDPGRSNAVTDGALGRDLAWTAGASVVSNFPPVSAGEVMVTGDKTGLVSATDVVTGEPRWQVQLAPPILATPAVVGDEVVVADGSKDVRALSLADGSTDWVRELDDVVAASPGIADDAVAVATQDGRLTVLELADGSVRWTTRLGGVATAAPAVDGDRIFVSDLTGSLTAYDLADGSTDWSGSMANGGQLEGVAAAHGRVLAQDDSGIVYDLDEEDGDVAWQSRTRGTGYGHLATTDDYVATLIARTDLSVLDATTGRRVWHVDVPTTSVAPVIVGGELVTVSEQGQVQVFDLATGDRSGGWELPRPVSGQEPQVDVPVGVVGDSVVISSDPNTGPAPATLYAYPLHGAGAGVLLTLDPHIVSSSPTGPVTAAGGDLYVPGYDSNLTRNSADGRATVLAHNDDRIATSAAVADGVAVVRKDDQLEAVPLDGGDPLWSVPAGNAYSGSTPLVVDGTVYAGDADGRVLAVSLRDGAVRWSAPTSSGYLPSTPVGLPDGDIVYGLGLTRYDGATGAPAWSHPEVVSYGAPATAGGVVFAAVDRQSDSSGFGAWDAATGAPLWFVPASPASYVGLTVADGVVLFSDAFGTVHALDAGTGAEKWSVALHRPVGGTPVVREGRVYVAGLGSPEVGAPRDYRVAALDLQTGRFLASWQPSLTSFWVVPFVSGGEDDALLVPTGDDLQDVVMGVSPHD